MIRLKKEAWLKFDEATGKHYLFCIQTGRHFLLNEVSYRMLELIQENKSKEEIIEAVTSGFEVSVSECVRDLDNLIQLISDSGLIE